MQRKGFLLVVCAALALAQWTTPALGQLMNCAADRERFCGGVRRGDGRVVTCLQQHAKDLSAACRQALGGAHAEGGGGTKAACREDAMKLCKSAIGDQARMKACMQEHAAQLSDGCKTALISQRR